MYLDYSALNRLVTRMSRYLYLIHIKKKESVLLDSIWTNLKSARKRYDELIESGKVTLVSFSKVDPNTSELNYFPKNFHRKE